MTAVVADLGADVRAWIQERWSPELSVREWWYRLQEARLVAPTWPEPYGRGLAPSVARAVAQELAATGTVAPPTGVIGVGMAGPTLLAHGTAEQRERYLVPMLRGEESWCQLFSEPGAGSDLPSLCTSAEPVDGGWLVTGQKLWSSGAHLARRGLLLVRTEPWSEGRDGISYFVLDLDQPGVEVRPLRTMSGDAHFCEVFLDNAWVADEDLIGAEGDGWRVARTTLAAERGSASDRAARGTVAVASGELGGQLDRRVSEVIADERRRTRDRARFRGSAIRAAELVALAREHGVDDEPAIRQGLARYWSLTTIQRLNQGRARTSPAAAAIGKLALGHVCRLSRELSWSILGARTMLAGADAPYGGSLQVVGLSSPGVTIGAGTDEIQRNTIAERTLGLPGEPR